ncbi:MAG TPA: hypothetical protein VFZ70_15260 [Euzebyales bacterium]
MTCRIRRPWDALADAPDLADIFICQFGGDTDAYRAAVADAYVAGLAEDRPDHAVSPGRRTFPWVARQILHRPPRQGHTRVVAVDGGSGAGKTTFAASLADALDAPAVHTDDVAWWEDFFDWTHLLWPTPSGSTPTGSLRWIVECTGRRGPGSGGKERRPKSATSTKTARGRADLIVSNDAAAAPLDATPGVVIARTATWTRVARPRSPTGSPHSQDVGRPSTSPRLLSRRSCSRAGPATVRGPRG